MAEIHEERDAITRRHLQKLANQLEGIASASSISRKIDDATLLVAEAKRLEAYLFERGRIIDKRFEAWVDGGGNQDG